MLPVLVSTQETQGQRKNDFCWCDEGELVRFALECDGEAVDGACGCRRAMSGFVTQKATTTMKVIGMDITTTEFVEKFKQSLKDGGWPVSDQDAQEEAKELLRIAAGFPIGSIVEKRGGGMQTRIKAK